METEPVSPDLNSTECLCDVQLAEAQKGTSGSQTLQRYASVLLMIPSQESGEDLISALKLGDSQYTSRTEGEPGTLAFRTFLQACPVICTLTPLPGLAAGQLP